MSATARPGFTEDANASAQDLSDSGTVSFDDIDTNDVVDISFALDNGDVAWSGGTHRSGAGDALVAGFSDQRDRRGGARAARRGATRSTTPTWTSSPSGETITFTYTVTATDSDERDRHRHGDASPSPAPTMRRR